MKKLLFSVLALIALTSPASSQTTSASNQAPSTPAPPTPAASYSPGGYFPGHGDQPLRPRHLQSGMKIKGGLGEVIQIPRALRPVRDGAAGVLLEDGF